MSGKQLSTGLILTCKKILKHLILFVIGGFVYCGIELLFRGRTHWSMFIVGGLCLIFCGMLNEMWDNPALWKQMVLGSMIITLFEFVSGCIVNLWLGWNVWDYSNMPMNVMGQICLPFSLLWCLMALLAIFLDDLARYLLFKEKFPHYHFF